MERIAIQVPAEVKSKLEELANKDCSSVARICRIAVEAYLKQRKAA